MASILNKIFVKTSKVFAHPLLKNGSTLPRVIGYRNTSLSSANVDRFTYCEEASDAKEYDLVFHKDKAVGSVLEEPQQLPDLSHITPELRPSFNFAYFANKSEIIQKLIDLGVDFHKIEQRRRIPSYLLKLDFEKDVKPYISFLFENGVPPEQLGRFFTKNPFICQENLDDLQVRINYLQSKKFTPEMISRIITVNPLWLQMTTKAVDKILGTFQKELRLTGEEIRNVVHKRPHIVSTRSTTLAEMNFFFINVIGFTLKQTKNIFLTQPYVWSINREPLQQRFDVMLVDMEIPISLIEAQPCCLLLRACKMKERHLFLKELGKAQYDPTKPNYISLTAISKGNDSTFCQEVAKTSIETYNLFLKTL